MHAVPVWRQCADMVRESVGGMSCIDFMLQTVHVLLETIDLCDRSEAFLYAGNWQVLRRIYDAEPWPVAPHMSRPPSSDGAEKGFLAPGGR